MTTTGASNRNAPGFSGRYLLYVTITVTYSSDHSGVRGEPVEPRAPSYSRAFALRSRGGRGTQGERGNVRHRNCAEEHLVVPAAVPTARSFRIRRHADATLPAAAVAVKRGRRPTPASGRATGWRWLGGTRRDRDARWGCGPGSSRPGRRRRSGRSRQRRPRSCRRCRSSL